MNEIILLKLGEVVLKGLNRRTFEDKLNANIRRRLQHYGSFHVYSKQSLIFTCPPEFYFTQRNCDGRIKRIAPTNTETERVIIMDRSSGILLPITALPSPYGIGILP